MNFPYLSFLSAILYPNKELGKQCMIILVTSLFDKGPPRIIYALRTCPPGNQLGMKFNLALYIPTVSFSEYELSQLNANRGPVTRPHHIPFSFRNTTLPYGPINSEYHIIISNET